MYGLWHFALACPPPSLDPCHVGAALQTFPCTSLSEIEAASSALLSFFDFWELIVPEVRGIREASGKLRAAQ